MTACPDRGCRPDLLGIAYVLLAMVMALPVPLGDMLPRLAMVFFSLGIMQKDEVAVINGGLCSIVTAVYLFLIWRTVFEIVQHVIDWFARLIS